jgi:ABC-type glycerol-3-phosphate transport system substrate-binding protein
MKHRLNRQLSIILICVTQILFFLPGGGCSGRRTAPRKKEENTIVTFWHAMGGPLGTALNSLVDEFNAAHPRGFIKTESMGSYEALKQKILAVTGGP